MIGLHRCDQWMADLCPCGQPLHYSNRRTREFVEDLIADLGPTVRVIIPQGTYLVPRHYIALHGLSLKSSGCQVRTNA